MIGSSGETEREPQALLRSFGRDGTTGPVRRVAPRPARSGARARRGSVRLRLPARAGGPEGLELGEQVFSIFDDLGDLAGMGRAWGDAQQAAPCLLETADDAVEDGGIDHGRASVEGGPAAYRSDRA